MSDEMEYMSKMNDCPDDIGKRAADEVLCDQWNQRSVHA